MNLTPKAALKTPALQTRPRVPDALLRREAFGVRASLAPLFRRRSSKVRFRGLRREPLREILSLNRPPANPPLTPLRRGTVRWASLPSVEGLGGRRRERVSVKSLPIRWEEGVRRM